MLAGVLANFDSPEHVLTDETDQGCKIMGPTNDVPTKIVRRGRQAESKTFLLNENRMAFRLSGGLPTCPRPYATFSTRLCSRSFDKALRPARILSLQCQELHSSLPGRCSRVLCEAELTHPLAMKQKQKQKAAIEDQADEPGFEDQNGGDLFGDLAAEATKAAKAALPIQTIPQKAEKPKTQPRAAGYSPEKKAQFDELFSRIENRAGKSLGCSITENKQLTHSDVQVNPQRLQRSS